MMGFQHLDVGGRIGKYICKEILIIKSIWVGDVSGIVHPFVPVAFAGEFWRGAPFSAKSRCLEKGSGKSMLDGRPGGLRRFDIGRFSYRRHIFSIDIVLSQCERGNEKKAGKSKKVLYIISDFLRC